MVNRNKRDIEIERKIMGINLQHRPLSSKC